MTGKLYNVELFSLRPLYLKVCDFGSMDPASLRRLVFGLCQLRGSATAALTVFPAVTFHKLITYCGRFFVF